MIVAAYIILRAFGGWFGFAFVAVTFFVIVASRRVRSMPEGAQVVRTYSLSVPLPWPFRKSESATLESASNKDMEKPTDIEALSKRVGLSD